MSIPTRPIDNGLVEQEIELAKSDEIYHNYIRDWKLGIHSGMRGKTAISRHIRKYLFLKYSNKCSRCGWGEINIYTSRIPLEVEHIDGNHTNNQESNLDLVCPNCHSLTGTYRSLNNGKGRPRIR